MKILKKIILLIMVFVLLVFIMSLFVKIKSFKYIRNNLPSSKKYDYIIVLGSAVYNGKPRAILEARLKKAIDLYQKGIAPKILMTGDHKDDGYNEVEVMKNYAIENGVAEDDIILDHLGLSTYDSIYRAINIFQIKKAVVVSQKYHLYRAIYIARQLGMDAYGVWSNTTNDGYQIIREIREVLARDKDYFKTLFKVRSSF